MTVRITFLLFVLDVVLIELSLTAITIGPISATNRPEGAEGTAENGFTMNGNATMAGTEERPHQWLVSSRPHCGRPRGTPTIRSSPAFRTGT